MVPVGVGVTSRKAIMCVCSYTTREKGQGSCIIMNYYIILLLLLLLLLLLIIIIIIIIIITPWPESASGTVPTERPPLFSEVSDNFFAHRRVA
jgi:hypothetical protein